MFAGGYFMMLIQHFPAFPPEWNVQCVCLDDQLFLHPDHI